MLNKELEEFSNKMQLTYDRHYNIKNDSYKNCDIIFLLNKFKEEEKEVKYLINKLFQFNQKISNHNINELQKELIDLSLMCMMLYYRANTYRIK